MRHPKQAKQLVDRFGRSVDYVRISITDRCDFRCVYCMSEEMTFLPREQILSLEEIYNLAMCFSELGVTKIRITGGEPLIRRNVLDLMQKIGNLPLLEELVMTTNGSNLAEYAEQLKQAQVSRLNISLDTLDAVKFKELTRSGDLDTVLKGIRTAIATGFKRIKINAVILKNRNHDEVIDLVQFALDSGIDISFIEEMPLGVISSHNRAEAYYSSDQIREELATRFTLEKIAETTAGPSDYYQIQGTTTKVGFISPHSHNFCSTCNRVRLTAEGRLLLCLGNEHSIDLKAELRSHPGDTEHIKQVLIDAMDIKPEKHEFNLDEQPIIMRHMNSTGG
ncbi:GTP 3',8-cyclase [Bathymodiolus japonicus methanotrophic gill symbiont]|uniref:GTP 3',8-cyclase MoaA n=1 Tax=Bathymodiolus japonicus methanotrophic gill symbiont TaxID=113269 RepID=UPI001B527554|nr:GTP 3',8-cyclase MoaA [Bathymodiolus japonicus methanotrophic gill symbiont]GFO71754.1 GTP 3',8-cyclase [Bathymodiolus japonicus methanotrophic gill symbiont]